MKTLDEQKALHFILKKIHSKQGIEQGYTDWLYSEGLLSGDESVNEDEKVCVYENLSKIMLKPSEEERLKLYYTHTELDKVYSKLDTYLANRTKRPYKSHYAAINSWVIEQALGFKREVPLQKEVKHWNDE